MAQTIFFFCVCFDASPVGHIQADCPTIRVSGNAETRCYDCGMFGHIARNCRNQPHHDLSSQHGHFGDMNMNMGMGSGMHGNGRGTGGYTNAGIQGRIVICYKCGGPNHFARDCKAARPVRSNAAAAGSSTTSREIVLTSSEVLLTRPSRHAIDAVFKVTSPETALPRRLHPPPLILMRSRAV
ncbi:unnamed protein product [Mortierella alpina]